MCSLRDVSGVGPLIRGLRNVSYGQSLAQLQVAVAVAGGA